MFTPSRIHNVAEAACNQFLALTPHNVVAHSLEDAIILNEQQLTFLKNCKKVQDAAKEKLAKLQEYKIHSKVITEKLTTLSSAAEAALPHLGPVLLEGKYLVMCTPLPFAIESCGLCGHGNNGSYEFTVTNVSQQGPHNTFKFQKLNIHAIIAHKNFSYPGNLVSLEGYEISVFDTLKTLELLK